MTEQELRRIIRQEIQAALSRKRKAFIRLASRQRQLRIEHFRHSLEQAWLSLRSVPKHRPY